MKMIYLVFYMEPTDICFYGAFEDDQRALQFAEMFQIANPEKEIAVVGFPVNTILTRNFPVENLFNNKGG